jgi:hypothetical protein
MASRVGLALRPLAVAASGVVLSIWPAPGGLPSAVDRQRFVACPAGGCSVRLRRRAEPGAVPASYVVSAARAAGHRGQHPPHPREHAAAGTARSGGPVSSGTPGRPPGPAAGCRRLDGADDVQGPRTRHDDAPSPGRSCPLPWPPRGRSRRQHVTGPPPRDGTGEDLPPADTERTAPALIQQRPTGWVSRPVRSRPGARLVTHSMTVTASEHCRSLLAYLEPPICLLIFMAMLSFKPHRKDRSGVVAGGVVGATDGSTSAASDFPGLLHSVLKACVTSAGEGGSGRSHRRAKASVSSGQTSRWPSSTERIFCAIGGRTTMS